ncbi:MAG: hypothetical protein V1703_04060 [Candidatus Altiarchaeota archaeon]
MKKLDSNFQPPLDEIRAKVSQMVSSLELGDFDRNFWRNAVERDFKVMRLKDVKLGETGFLGSDSSIAAKNVRYNALWGMHAVLLYGLFNGLENKDQLVGHGSVNYSSLMYDSHVDLGSFNPYWMIEHQMNCIRIEREYSSIVDGRQSLVDSGFRVDFPLVDGSLKTNSDNLSMRASLPAAEAALKAQERLLGLGRVVSMVEDSHASDISRRFGLNMSNLMFFNLVLRDGEYVVEEGRFNVCYLKLPGKRLDYLDGLSMPLTVRWEFSYPGFHDDLSLLASMWLKEDDVLHPQLYPLRIADYLTRRVNTAGVIDEIVGELKPELEFRDLREAYFE